MYIKLIIIYFLLILFFNISAEDSITEPTNPQTPNISNFSESSIKKDKKGKRLINVLIKLCDGREINGRTEITRDELIFQHEREGIKYTKKVQVQNIKQIYILNFSHKNLKKTKDGTTFQFDPGEVEITFRDSDTIKILGLSTPDFHRIELQNNNGSTILYSYWIDLQFETGKWYSKLPPYKGNYRDDCHNDVVRMIRFDSNID
jgi:hypothetical protein